MSIVVYSTKKCGQCTMTYRQLEQHSLPYEVVDVSEDQETMQKLREMGFRQLPVVVAGERSWNGFRPDMIRALAA